MVLTKAQLPGEFAGFDLLRESEIDNEQMAKHTIGNKTADQMRASGRIGGYVREFIVPQGAPTLREEPAEIVMAGTVVHLFDSADAVKRWIDESFLRDFRNSVGTATDDGQMVQGVEILSVDGFHDYAASLLVVQDMAEAVLASTIVDFRMGNLLGVAYVVAKKDITLLDLAKRLAVALEKQMVRVALGSA